MDNLEVFFAEESLGFTLDNLGKIAASAHISTTFLNNTEDFERLLKEKDGNCMLVVQKPTDAPVVVENKDVDKKIDERLQKILIMVGIPSHIKGSKFLRDAIKVSIGNPDMINNITKKLYPSIALINNTSPSKVERAIRHAIEVSWSRGKIENINNIFGLKVFSKGEKPTNGELIALLADKIMIEITA